MPAPNPNRNSGTVRLETGEGFGIVIIDNPPVNAGSHAVRSGLLACLETASELELRGVIIMGAGRGFIAGSDIREFGAPLQAPELPEVIAAVEACPHPVCAAIHGAALGGGFELALGCDLRVGAPDAIVGLPEVTLGMVPGAGGTQRLPRLIGVDKAIPLITSGRHVRAPEAEQLGILDAVSDSNGATELIACAKATIERQPCKRVLRRLPVPDCDGAAVDAAEAEALRRSKGRPNVTEAIRLIRASAQVSADAALMDERRVFQTLRTAPEAFALRHLFFAERAAARVDGLSAAPARIERIGIVGGGTMGQGICRTCLAGGLSVILVERDADARDTAHAAMSAALDKAVVKGRLDADTAEVRKNSLDTTCEISALAECDLIIEAVFEDMATKKALFTKLDHIIRPDAILASNTSYLDLDDLASVVSRPENVVGLHFFSPANVMKLLEVVRTAKGSDQTLATALGLARKLGKQPVVAEVAEGFIGNRIYAAYRRHAEFLVEDGAAPWDVDAAATGFGFALGPFAVGDMSGLDIAWQMRKRQAATRDPRARYVEIPDRLCEAGRLGRKTGAGWYDYTDGRAVPSDEVAALIAQARSDKGITACLMSPQEITDRLLGAVLNEAAKVLDEGVARQAGDIDVTLVHGYGFPRWRGGPLWWASQQPPERIAAMIAAVAEAEGTGFKAGPVETTIAPLRTEQHEIGKRKAGHD